MIWLNLYVIRRWFSVASRDAMRLVAKIMSISYVACIITKLCVSLMLIKSCNTNFSIKFQSVSSCLQDKIEKCYCQILAVNTERISNKNQYFIPWFYPKIITRTKSMILQMDLLYFICFECMTAKIVTRFIISWCVVSFSQYARLLSKGLQLESNKISTKKHESSCVFRRSSRDIHVSCLHCHAQWLYRSPFAYSPGFSFNTILSWKWTRLHQWWIFNFFFIDRIWLFFVAVQNYLYKRIICDAIITATKWMHTITSKFVYRYVKHKWIHNEYQWHSISFPFVASFRFVWVVCMWEPFVNVTNGVLKLIVLIYLSWFSLSSFVVCHRYSATETHVKWNGKKAHRSTTNSNEFECMTAINQINFCLQFTCGFFLSFFSFVQIVWVFTLLKLFVSTNLFKLGIPCMHFLNRFFSRFPITFSLLLFLVPPCLLSFIVLCALFLVDIRPLWPGLQSQNRKFL